MKTKTINIKHDDYVFEVKKHTHFGWEVLTYTHASGDKYGKLTLKQDNVQHLRTLKKLEKQANKINRNFPWGTVISLILGAACIVCYFLKVVEYYGFFLAGAILFFAITFAYTLNFILLKVYKGKLLEELYKASDELCGKIISRPIPSNIIAKDKYTNAIKNSIQQNEKLRA